MSVPDQPPRLRMEHITKHFGGVHALRDVTFTANAGEVHALCGENGAGKSTLMKILAGAITDFDGRIVFEGKPVAFAGPGDAEDAGIRIIYQELNLVPELTVAANIFLGREKTLGFGLLDNRAMEREARRLFERLGAPISPRSLVSDLRIGDQQMVEIAKALAFEAAIVIMDEPTSALSDSEVARLFRVIDDLRRGGTTVLYISHKMNEVFTLADRVTVLRDGQLVASAARNAITPDQVVRWMVGREIAALDYQKHPIGERAVLEVDGLSLLRPQGSGRPSLRDIRFAVHAGEVVGVAGLLGAGRTELLEAIYGASPTPPGGTIRLQGRPVRFHHPDDAIRAGIAMVTEDRKTLGLFDRMTVAENITLRRLPELTFGTGPLINPRAERRAVGWAIDQLAIRTAGGDVPVTSLSGGNQQKCILARWLLIEPRLLLLDEPTRGIDVGAKAEIYQLIRRLAGQGRAILMTSSELPELLAVADRILVLCEGRLTAEIPRAEATEEAIMHAATRFLDRTTAGEGPK
ncbi:MAG TPA: sugar ABC transporter ATP-binding protein [Isosphaeraceae bacterium]|nr:sugar ABC transporter ATP-binding protein [Isosphaeraceae bacterium]